MDINKDTENANKSDVDQSHTSASDDHDEDKSHDKLYK